MDGTPLNTKKKGSLMGPFCYNVLCIDLFYLIGNNIKIFNYADDNTIMCTDDDLQTVVTNLQNMSNVMIKWFTDNSMKVNPDKFNTIVFGND